ncbi:MAG TPA: molybdopterin-dependent oxidoreductase [Thiopseudomonas sp.]|nr:molybdopterin-dependent oxidoreductase [Thiopseudomonas sp.]
MANNKNLTKQVGSLIVGFLWCLALQATADTAEQALELPKDKVVLTVDGLIEQTNMNGQAVFDLTMLQSLPVSTISTSTVVTDGVKRFDGVLVRDLFARLGVAEHAQYVEAVAFNDYRIDIPLVDFYEYDVLLATHMDGQQLTLADKGPLWVVYPRDEHRKLQDIRFDYRWVWQLKQLSIR